MDTNLLLAVTALVEWIRGKWDVDPSFRFDGSDARRDLGPFEPFFVFDEAITVLLDRTYVRKVLPRIVDGEADFRELEPTALLRTWDLAEEAKEIERPVAAGIDDQAEDDGAEGFDTEPAPWADPRDYVPGKGLREGKHGPCPFKDHKGKDGLLAFLIEKKKTLHCYYQGRHPMVYLPQFQAEMARSAKTPPEGIDPSVMRAFIQAEIANATPPRCNITGLNPSTQEYLAAHEITTREQVADLSEEERRALFGKEFGMLAEVDNLIPPDQ